MRTTSSPSWKATCGDSTMNDYAHGAPEALAWTLNPLEEAEDFGRIRRQLEEARDDLLAGVTVNLRQRLMTRKRKL